MEPVDKSNVLNINVGILGHVDAGKTALVRALSTSLSTAALDKNPQSQQRGITLDLGFSAFTLPMPAHLTTDPSASAYDSIQFTLVDCPGHASLIRTIIGGAQIIDMILLVVDANKGIQTQTAECIVIGEITTDNMIVVLNKVDMIPEAERSTKIERVSNRIRKVFSTTKFAGVPIVCTAAAVGGEKSTGAAAAASLGPTSKGGTQGIDDLVELIKSKVVIPTRNYSAPFYYAIDHCFAIKGHGTVLTGTVLSGSVTASSVIELPQLQLQRKVKSLQMFRKPVKGARQGDRVGICITNLDPTLIERGIAAAPGTVPLLQSVLCLVKKVRFFRGACKSMTKFHVSIGHSTVIATATFFGHKQLGKYTQQSPSSHPAGGAADSTPTTTSTTSTTVTTAATGGAAGHSGHATLNAGYHRSFPVVDFQFYNPDSASSAGASAGTGIGAGGKGSTTGSGEKATESSKGTGDGTHYGYDYQDEMMSAEGLAYGGEPVQWALLQFQQAVYCPLGSLVIGSRLDADTTDRDPSLLSAASAAASPSGAQQCRLAFYGPVKAALSGEADLLRTGVYTWRTKECEVFLLSDVRKGLCYEAVLWKLVSGGGSVTAFLGLRVESADKRCVGTIVSSYGADGKCRVKFPEGCRLAVGQKMLFRYKRYVFDKTKRMVQTGLDELRAEEDIAPAADLVGTEGAEGQGGADRTVLGEGAETERRDRTKKNSKKSAKKERASAVESLGDTAAVAVTEGASEEVAPEKVNVATMAMSSVELGSTASASKADSMQETTSVAAPAVPTSAPPPAVPVAATHAEPPAPPAGAHTDLPEGELRSGIIESSKAEEPTPDASSPPSMVAIVKGAFRMEENVKLFAGSKVQCGAVEGTLLGPFGKLGKCKVRFPHGTVCEVGAAVCIYIK